MCKDDITRHLRVTLEPFIAYWDNIWTTLLTPEVNINICLWHNNFGIKVEWQLWIPMPCLWGVCSGWAAINLTCNHMAPSFCVRVDCYESYMNLIRAWDKEPPKPIWLVKTLLSPNFVPTSPDFINFRWDTTIRIPKTRMWSPPI